MKRLGLSVAEPPPMTRAASGWSRVTARQAA